MKSEVVPLPYFYCKIFSPVMHPSGSYLFSKAKYLLSSFRSKLFFVLASAACQPSAAASFPPHLVNGIKEFYSHRFSCVFLIQFAKNHIPKIWMIGFNPQPSGVRNYRSANCATNTAKYYLSGHTFDTNI